ncbi:glycosyltransferase [Pseudomonas sp. J452]|uniref:glycosyltransferase family 4 protein n=1 Tax=Pseudomonas sp. J452 TaxID=2898441 RepID=UPI0021ADC8C5|nr:glycosyltransferase [Pseudomonas sp. J452]UUY07393.1 glycosyltransferase [Pseudomonas sp. J452]
MKVLIIGYVWPEPRSSAAGSRMIELIELFRAQGWTVTFASAAALSEHRADLAALDVPEVPITLNCDSFDAFVSALQPDLVLFDRFFSEEQFGWRVERACPQALRILETCDLHSLRDARQRLLKAAQQACSSEAEKHQQGAVSATAVELFNAMAMDDMAQREIAAIYRCDLSLLISDFELQLLREQFGVPAALLHHCTLMLIPTATAQPAFEQRTHFLSIGNFRHAPNWDAVLWLKQQLWPLIRQRLPQAQLHVYGSYTPPKATALHNPKQGFHVLGWADDAHAVMVQARVCLAPLRFGAGIKGKLADAMACGTPSVTTPIGSEGMAGELPWGGAVVDDAQAFAEAAVALHEDQTLWQQAQANGARILAERFDRQQSGQALVERLLVLRANLPAERRANFVGGMLRHHTLKSTQYMAQWIAAKNRGASPDFQDKSKL